MADKAHAKNEMEAEILAIVERYPGVVSRSNVHGYLGHGGHIAASFDALVAAGAMRWAPWPFVEVVRPGVAAPRTGEH